ncbi:MAG: TonB C-terminal domain-containing protein [bacterium]|nr:TonB C-terminal domain-containing protein [bacterium]
MMNQGVSHRQRLERRIRWTLAILLSLLLHVGAGTGVKYLNLLQPESPPTRDESVVQMVFAPQEKSETQPFAELPADRADEAPDQADLLSNLQSRARDATSGERDTQLPRSEGEAEIPQIAMDRAPTGMEGRAFEETPPPAPIREERPVTTPTEQPETEPQEVVTAGLSSLELLDPIEEQVADRFLDVIDSLSVFNWSDRPAGQSGPSHNSRGNDDLAQEMMANSEGSITLVGDYSLDTTTWVYGFWMQRFKRQLQENWYAPYAFQIGLLDGWTLIEMEVSRDGRLLHRRVLGEQGHTSLAEASVAAIETAAPYEPFPEHLPEESMTLRIKMIYNGPPRTRNR